VLRRPGGDPGDHPAVPRARQGRPGHGHCRAGHGNDRPTRSAAQTPVITRSRGRPPGSGSGQVVPRYRGAFPVGRLVP
jgi:hypothetical protein